MRLLALMAFAVLAARAQAADNPCWRGLAGDGRADPSGHAMITDAAQARIRWQRPEIKSSWATGFPGFSTPIIADGKVFVYRHEGDKRKVFYPVYFNQGKQKAPNDDYNARRASPTAADVITAVDLVSGEIVWERRFPGARNPQFSWKWGCRMDPVYTDGKVYAVGTSGRVYCLDGVTGQSIWQNELGITSDGLQQWAHDHYRVGIHPGFTRNRIMLTPMSFAEGVVVAGQGLEGEKELLGFDAATGRILWSNGGGGRYPIRWRRSGSTRLVDGRNVWDPKTGKTISSISESEPFVCMAGDRLVLFRAHRGKGKEIAQDAVAVCYRLGDEGGQLLWETPLAAWRDGLELGKHLPGMSVAAATDTHIFVAMKDRPPKGGGGNPFKQRLPGASVPRYAADFVIVCLELETGKVVSHVMSMGESGDKNNCSSLVIADGLLYRKAGNGVQVLTTDPKDFRSLGVIDLPDNQPWIALTPVVADGYLVLRCKQSLVCIDVRKDPVPVTPLARPAPPTDASGLAAVLASGDYLQASCAVEAIASKGKPDAAMTAALVDGAGAAIDAERWGIPRLALRALRDTGGSESLETRLAAAASLAAVRELRFGGMRSVAAGRALLALAGRSEDALLKQECLRAVATLRAAGIPLRQDLLALALGDDFLLAAEAALALKWQQEAQALTEADQMAVAKRLAVLRAKADPKTVAYGMPQYDRARARNQLAMLLWESRPTSEAVLAAVVRAVAAVAWPSFAATDCEKYLKAILIAAGEQGQAALKTLPDKAPGRSGGAFKQVVGAVEKAARDGKPGVGRPSYLQIDWVARYLAHDVQAAGTLEQAQDPAVAAEFRRK